MKIKEQLNSTAALGPKPNDSFQEALKLLIGLASLPSLSGLGFFFSLLTVAFPLFETFFSRVVAEI